VRVITFANGRTVRERIVDINDRHRRLSYTVIGGRTSHHNASMQVLSESESMSRLIWLTDLLPDEMAAPIAEMVEFGSGAIKRTLESRGEA
jgi:hypothetical protein